MVTSVSITTQQPTYKQLISNTFDATTALIERFDTARKLVNDEAAQTTLRRHGMAKDRVTRRQEMDEEHTVKRRYLEAVRRMSEMSPAQKSCGESFTPVQIRRTSK